MEIGAWSYIGPHCVIEAGSRIGRGSVVRAGTRVRGSFPDFAVLEGSPAQVVGDSRDGDETLLQRHPQCREHHAAWTAAPAPGPADDDTHRR